MTYQELKDYLILKGYIPYKHCDFTSDYFLLPNVQGTVFANYGPYVYYYDLVCSDSYDIYSSYESEQRIKLENLTQEKLDTIISNIDSKIRFLTEYIKKRKIRKRKETLNKDFQ